MKTDKMNKTSDIRTVEPWTGVYFMGPYETWYVVPCKDLSIHQISGVSEMLTIPKAMEKYGPIGYWSKKRSECVRFSNMHKNKRETMNRSNA